MKCKLSKAGSVGYNAVAGVILERGETYDLSDEQIQQLGKQVEPDQPKKKARRKTKERK